MRSYVNLSDVDFEYLCKDVMSKKLNCELERFSPGRDGGIDLTDNAETSNILVQVKHYRKSDFSALKNSLKKELEKVKELNPKSYYICCSSELTPGNKKEIFAMFSAYMESDKNIIDGIEISDFLDKKENLNILTKHFKLWIESENILDLTMNKNIFIDCEELLYDIEQKKNLFVDTQFFYSALEILEKQNILMITGNPGVGKTLTSKMIVLYYAKQDYTVRYCSDSTNISSLKKSLSLDRDQKEILLIDDCFGQIYFDMKQSLSRELLSLLKYVAYNKNKKILLNSRITICNEALNNNEELKYLFVDNYKVYTLELNNLSKLEKAKILYNNLYYNNVNVNYYKEIVLNKFYLNIISHKNFNPRIIEYICRKSVKDNIEVDNYLKFIKDSLDDPSEIWKKEYENNLTRVDRILLNTLFSLTNTFIDKDTLEKCYIHRISNIPNLDFSINHFENSLARLSESMIKNYDKDGKHFVGVSNPSINDFLKLYISSNTTAKNEIVKYSIDLRQLERILNRDEYKEKIECIFDDKSILNFNFDDEETKIFEIAYHLFIYNLFIKEYEIYIKDWLKSLLNKNELYYKETWLLKYVIKQEIIDFYSLEEFFLNENNIRFLLNLMTLKDKIYLLDNIYLDFDFEIRYEYTDTIFCEIAKSILNTKYIYLDEYEGIEIEDIIDETEVDMNREDFYEFFDNVIVDYENAIIEDINNEMEEMFYWIPEDIKQNFESFKLKKLSILNIEDYVCDYFDYLNDKLHSCDFDQEGDEILREIDLIFSRNWNIE